jgi:predicted small metal-binding protein
VAITVGCTDFNQTCDFRITSGDDQTEYLVDIATEHALLCHPEFEADQDLLRDAIRSEIKQLITPSAALSDTAVTA